jgi:hypothetical protein
MNGTARFREDLRAAIGQAYVAFRAYELKPGFDHRCSPLATRIELARKLIAAPLRDVDAQDLAIYTFKASFTMGDPQDFKHFLPRMLELHALEPRWHAFETNIFGQLVRYEWRSWPQAEQRAIRSYLVALWREIIGSFPSHLSPADFLTDAQSLGLDLNSFLDVWHPAHADAQVRRLCQFVEEYFGRPDDFRDDAASQIEDWLRTRGVRDALEQAFLRHGTEPFAESLARAADWLHWRGL